MAQALLPTAEELAILADVPVASNAVATEAQIRRILALAIIAVPATSPQTLVAVALACAHQGSSNLVKLEGNHGDIPLASIVPTIQAVCTLRQFCMYYAKVVWNALLRSNTPPANFTRLGYSQSTRFAGFDFFYGVTHAAVPIPPGGLARLPTEEETKASNINRTLAIRKASTQQNITNHAEIVGRQLIQGAMQPPQISWH
uniref:Capsid protein n=1 Tax=Saffron-associated alphaflexivirus TaxID=3125858 RepID=A0AAU6S482_9VIRU